jgi:hypothetical protein
MNWEWLKNEGLDFILFDVIMTENERDKLTLMNILYDFIKTDSKEFFLELNKKLASNQNKIIIEFLFTILPLCHDLNKSFYNELKDFIFDLCINSKTDLSIYVSLLCDAFFFFNPASDELIEKIMNFFKSCLRNEMRTVFSSAIVQIISLMDKFGKKIDVNSAQAGELAVLPGINIVTAKKIVEHRNINGDFKSSDDFIKVAEVKEHFVAKIKDMIEIKDSTTNEHKNGYDSDGGRVVDF